MPQLPNADKAIVPRAKITGYLLNLSSKHGQPKARFFLSFGYTIEAWSTFAEALQTHAQAYDVADTRETDYGSHYVIEGPLETPDGRNPWVRSVWKIETGSEIPSLISAYPVKEEDQHETI